MLIYIVQVFNFEFICRIVNIALRNKYKKMKKLLSLIFILPMLVLGQWTENFDSGTTLPAGWTTIKNGSFYGWAPIDLILGLPNRELKLQQ